MAHCRFHPFKQWEYLQDFPLFFGERSKEIKQSRSKRARPLDHEIDFSRASLTVCFRPQSSITNLPSGSSLRSRETCQQKTGHVRKAKEKMMKTMVSMVSFFSLPEQKKTESSTQQDLGKPQQNHPIQLVSSESSEKCIETTIQQYSVYRHTPNVSAKKTKTKASPKSQRGWLNRLLHDSPLSLKKKSQENS